MLVVVLTRSKIQILGRLMGETRVGSLKGSHWWYDIKPYETNLIYYRLTSSSSSSTRIVASLGKQG
jgi:hypothetical protein